MSESPEWKYKTLAKRLGVRYSDLTPDQKHQDQMERTRRCRLRAENKDVPKLLHGIPGLTTEERKRMYWMRNNEKNRIPNIEARKVAREQRMKEQQEEKERQIEVVRDSPEHVALKNMILQFRSLGLPVSEANESPSAS